MLTRIRPTHIVLSALLGLSFALPGPISRAEPAAPQSPPPLPPVISVTDLGSVRQNPVIYGRDGTYSTLFNGQSFWTFGDTPLAVPGVNGNNWVDNSLSWTSNLDASHGITLEHDLLDSTRAPAEFLPYTPAEQQYNYTHDTDHCTVQPCGAEFAMWGGHAVPDPERNRLLLFYDEIWRIPGQPGWTSIGTGIAVATPGRGISRPIQNPGNRTPTLLWTADAGEIGLDGGYVISGTMLYSYGCEAGFLIMNCIVGRVPLANVLDKTQWSYYAGNDSWSPNQAGAITIFNGGAAGNTVFYVPYLNMYMAVYNPVFSNDVYYRVSWTPWGPWSDQAYMFTGQPGWQGNIDYAGRAHPEFAEQDGRVQYITYVHATGFLRSDLPLVQVIFGDPE